MANSQSDDQIQNSVLATNEILLGSSTAKSMATMYLNLAQAAGMASQNAVTNQQHLNILGAAAVAAGTSGLLRNGFADQIEKLTPTERLDYLQKLMTLATNPTGTPAAADSSGGSGATSSTDSKTSSGSADKPASGTSTETKSSDDSKSETPSSSTTP